MWGSQVLTPFFCRPMQTMKSDEDLVSSQPMKDSISDPDVGAAQSWWDQFLAKCPSKHTSMFTDEVKQTEDCVDVDYVSLNSKFVGSLLCFNGLCPGLQSWTWPIRKTYLSLHNYYLLHSKKFWLLSWITWNIRQPVVLKSCWIVWHQISRNYAYTVTEKRFKYIAVHMCPKEQKFSLTTSILESGIYPLHCIS